MSVSSPQGRASAPPQTHLGRDGSLSRDEHAGVRPNYADTVSTNARAFYESEALRAVAARDRKIRTRRAINMVLAAEYRTTLPHDRLLAEEIAQTRRQLNLQSHKRVSSAATSSTRSALKVKAAWQGQHLIAEGGRRLGGASQVTAAAEPLSLHRQISRSLPPNSAIAHAIHVPGGSRMFRFVVPGTFCSNLSCGPGD